MDTHREALHLALEGGINLIDTSANYGDGDSEALVGEVLTGLIGGLNMVKGAPHPELAKQFMDWVVSAEAQETQAAVGAYQLPTNTMAKVPEVSIPIDSVKTVDYDFKWVAENGVRITDRWTREVFTLPR